MKKDAILVILGFIALFGVLIAIWVTRSYFEAKAFNNITGKNVSTLDAMFVELRVNEVAE